MKDAIRQQVLARRDAEPAQARAAASAVITAHVAALPEFREANSVLAYMSMGSEFDTAGLVDALLSTGRVLGLPRVNRAERRLDLYRVRDPVTELVPGTWGIREPDPARCAPLDGSAVDVVVVPGVAFDRGAHRLGYGGGFYDRLLAAPVARAWRVAPAFSTQLVDGVPVEPHDLPMDIVVTELAQFRGWVRR